MRKMRLMGSLCAGLVAALTTAAWADGIFNDSYDASITFQDAPSLEQTRMNICFDGVDYWSSSGGSPGGDRLARYDATGNLLGTFQPNIDMRSVFTAQDGAPVYAREFNQRQVRIQTSPGVFGNDVALQGGALDAQSAVVFNTAATEFRAMNAGSVTRWDRQGAFQGSIALQGFGSQNNENVYPQNRGMGSADAYTLTYSNGILSGWNESGQRVGTTRLNGAGTSFDSHFSISYANGMAFVVDGAGELWRGYDVGLGGGGGKCQYTVKSAKGKGGCQTCPSKGENFGTDSPCEEVEDCRKKVKTTISCPEGPGTCKVKGKREACE